MGCEGWVKAYDKAKVEAAYAEMWPKHDITADWWWVYGDRPQGTLTLGGKEWLIDYADNSSQFREGWDHDFWFEDTQAQARVLAVLQKVGAEDSTEVWT